MFNPVEVLEMAREHAGRFCQLQFIDIFGVLKSAVITSESLERVLTRGFVFDGSMLEGAPGDAADLILKPDPGTLLVFPWRNRDGAVKRFLCDVANFDGSPSAACSRTILKNVIKELDRKGLKILVSPKVEFYLFHTEESAFPRASYEESLPFALAAGIQGEHAQQEIALALDEMGMDLEGSNSAPGTGQHEITLGPGNPLATADNLATIKFVVKTIARRYGLQASFMPKPLNGLPGSSLILRLTNFGQDVNPSFDQGLPRQISQEAWHFIAGVLAHTPANCAITNPVVNSYKRLMSGGTPSMLVSWSEQNRKAVIRVPPVQGQETCVEIRSPDPACNPYLTLAALLKAGLDGINKLSQPPPLLTQEAQTELNQLETYQAACLPRNLEEAVRELASDALIRTMLGEYIYLNFTKVKRAEWECFQDFVHPWEQQKYLFQS